MHVKLCLRSQNIFLFIFIQVILLTSTIIGDRNGKLKLYKNVM